MADAVGTRPETPIAPPSRGRGTTIERPQAERSEPEVEVLAARARAGEARAFEGLYARYAPMIHGILVSMVPPSEADDLVQDVFVAAWRGIASLRQADHVGGWLAAIARNEGRAALRRRRPLERIPDDLPDPAPPRRDGAEILAAIRALPEAYRETLALRLVEGFTGPEIATATGLTHGSVRVNLHRGMKLLRGALSERGYA